YLISWKGYPSSENSWESAGNILHETLNTYKKAHPRDFLEIFVHFAKSNIHQMPPTCQTLCPIPTE
ncbi:hypothetical protein PAXRUDRAFT_152161, partial [Paxillus rubicundulus Ve08.2h10]